MTAEPEADPEVDAAARAADRVVFFSDAVIAIAITLLALDLAVPVGPAGAREWADYQLWDALKSNSDQYYAFLISFAVIGNHWVSHRHIFRYVNRVDSRIGEMNMVWLLTMIITPVATRLLEGNGAMSLRFTIYTLVQILASLCLFGMSWRIQRVGLLRPDAPDSARHPDWAPYIAWILVFAVSIPVAFAFGGYAYAVWAAVPVATRLFRRRLHHGHTA